MKIVAAKMIMFVLMFIFCSLVHLPVMAEDSVAEARIKAVVDEYIKANGGDPVITARQISLISADAPAILAGLLSIYEIYEERSFVMELLFSGVFGEKAEEAFFAALKKLPANKVIHAILHPLLEERELDIENLLDLLVHTNSGIRSSSAILIKKQTTINEFIPIKI